VPRGDVEVAEDERYLDVRLSTVTGAAFSGQVVEASGEVAYVSLAATKEWLAAA
jgi:hypothetical protein